MTGSAADTKNMSEEAIAELRKQQDRQAVLRIAAPGNNYEVESRKRKGVGHQFSEPEGHQGPKSQVRGSVGAVDQVRLDKEHSRRLAELETLGPPFLHQRLESESCANTRDASFGYLQEEGDKTELSILGWNAGNLLRTGQKPFSNLRSNTYIAAYLLKNHAHIKLVQEANGLDKIVEGQQYLLSESTGCAVLVNGLGCSIKQLTEGLINPFGAKVATLYWLAAEVTSLEKRAGSFAWRVGSFHVNHVKAHRRDCAVAALEAMFAEAFALQLDFLAGDANGAGLDACAGDYLQVALDNALAKLEPHCRPVITRFCCAPEDCIHGIALHWNRGSAWKKVRQVACPVEKEELQIRPRDKDSHVPLKVAFSTGKAQRSPAAKVFRAQQRRAKPKSTCLRGLVMSRTCG